MARSSDTTAMLTGPDGIITLHPVPGRLPRWGSLAALPAALIGIVRLLLLGWVGVGIAVAVIGLGIAVALLVRWLRLFHSYARLTPSKLTVRRWFGRPRTIAREDVSSVVLVVVRLSQSSGQPARQLILFLGAGGRCLLSLDCLGIPLREVAQFAHALAVPVVTRPGQTGPAELRRDYPGSISAFWSHQAAFGIGIAFALVAVVVAGVVGYGVLTGQFGPHAPEALGATQSERITAGSASGSPVADVTVVGVDNPARAAIPASASQPGTHFAGVEMRVKNTGSQLVLSPSYATVVFDATGARYFVDSIDDAVAGQLNTDRDVAVGRTETAYVLIRVPDTAVLTKVQFNSTSDENSTLTWIVPRRQPPRPAPAALGQALSLGDQTVTILAVDDPAHGSPSTVALPPGAHLVGVEVRIVNGGTLDADPPSMPLSVVDSRGGQNDGVDISASGDAAINAVKPGDTVTATVYFDVPVGARVTEVDYEYDPQSLGGGRTSVAWAG